MQLPVQEVNGSNIKREICRLVRNYRILLCPTNLKKSLEHKIPISTELDAFIIFTSSFDKIFNLKIK